MVVVCCLLLLSVVCRGLLSVGRCVCVVVVVRRVSFVVVRWCSLLVLRVAIVGVVGRCVSLFVVCCALLVDCCVLLVVWSRCCAVVVVCCLLFAVYRVLCCCL